AFASDRYSNFDIFTISANGGEAKRVTYHSAQEYPYDFTADDKSIISDRPEWMLPLIASSQPVPCPNFI
uniref:hypothetical protein n=1 Tax=Klebsiella pneumoniae TaxID=573 RepID=UPI00195349F5